MNSPENQAEAAAENFETTNETNPKPRRGRPFRPGQSGNPRGRPKAGMSFAEKCRRAVLNGETLHNFWLSILEDEDEDTGHRLEASRLLARYSFGDPPKTLSIEGGGGASGIQVNLISFAQITDPSRLPAPDQDAIEVQSFERRLPPPNGSKGRA